MRPETLRLTTDQPYGLAVAAFRWPGSNSPDFAAAQVLADVLGSQRGSLYESRAERQGVERRVSGLIASPKRAWLTLMASFPAGGNGTALLRQVREILQDIAKNGVPADLVSAAKRHEAADAEFEKNSISGSRHALV